MAAEAGLAGVVLSNHGLVSWLCCALAWLTITEKCNQWSAVGKHDARCMGFLAC